MSKRTNAFDANESFHKKCNVVDKSSRLRLNIDHTRSHDHIKNADLLRGKRLNDATTDIKFIVENEEISSHSQVLQILSNQRQLVKDLIEKDKQLAKQQRCPEANIFQMSGTTPQAFRVLLNYIYSGKVDCDLKTGIDLAVTANKLKFHPLVASIAQQMAHNINDVLKWETVDDLYHISKMAENKPLYEECCAYLNRNAALIKDEYLSRDIKASDDSNVLIYAFDKHRYINYIHFELPDPIQICFTISVSIDRKNWSYVLKNDDIWCQSWNWVYFKEQRVKYIRIICTDKEDNNFNIRSIRDDHFLCKRANVELTFDEKTSYLKPTFDIIKYPIKMTKHFFDEKQKNGFTYCTSDAPKKDKEKYYFYHRIGDGKPLEFYLPQTCLVNAFRFRLWDLDDRTYDFTVEVKHNEEEEWLLIKNGDNKVFEKRKSWQTIRMPSYRAVRWIKITGIKAPDNDPEFAIIHFECPPQTSS